MSIAPPVIAARNTLVAPSWSSLLVLIPFACSICEMMLPSNEPSVSIFEPTRTTGLAWAFAEPANAPNPSASSARRRMEIDMAFLPLFE